MFYQNRISPNLNSQNMRFHNFESNNILLTNFFDMKHYKKIPMAKMEAYGNTSNKGQYCTMYNVHSTEICKNVKQTRRMEKMEIQ